MRTISTIQKFLHSDNAATAVEYAVVLAAIVVAIILGVTSVGGGVSAWWTNIRNDITSSGS